MGSMDGSPITLRFVGGTLALFALLFFLLRRWEKKRTEALHGAALRLGLEFLEDGAALRSEGFFMMPLFSKGRQKTFSNVARNDDMICFGYRYTIGSGKNRSQVRQTVVAHRLRGCDLPAFQLKPEGFFDRMVGAMGGQDFDFDDDPEFSRAFRLQGLGERMIRELFSPDLRRALVAAPDWSIQGSGEWLLLYKKAVRVDPAELSQLIRGTKLLAEHFAR